MQEQQAKIVATTPPDDGYFPRINIEGTQQSSVSIKDYTLHRHVLHFLVLGYL
jgi:hypothetical protein